MSNLEHLVENGLTLLEKGVDYEEWRQKMCKDINWKDCNGNLSLDDLWGICQYVYYTYMPCTLEMYMNKFEHFTDDELYILMRALVESSWEFSMSGNYSKAETTIHTNLLNEVTEEMKRRTNNE